MVKFLGLPNAFARIHEFFQHSLVYYGPRPDLMEAVGDSLQNKGSFPVLGGPVRGTGRVKAKRMEHRQPFGFTKRGQNSQHPGKDLGPRR